MSSTPQLREEFGRLWRLGAPVALTQLGAMLLNVVDTIMVGQVSPEDLAGVALGNIYFERYFERWPGDAPGIAATPDLED